MEGDPSVLAVDLDSYLLSLDGEAAGAGGGGDGTTATTAVDLTVEDEEEAVAAKPKPKPRRRRICPVEGCKRHSAGPKFRGMCRGHFRSGIDPPSEPRWSSPVRAGRPPEPEPKPLAPWESLPPALPPPPPPRNNFSNATPCFIAGCGSYPNGVWRGLCMAHSNRIEETGRIFPPPEQFEQFREACQAHFLQHPLLHRARLKSDNQLCTVDGCTEQSPRVRWGGPCEAHYSEAGPAEKLCFVVGCKTLGVYGTWKGMCKAHGNRINAACGGDTGAVFPSHKTENKRFREACREYFREHPIAPPKQFHYGRAPIKYCFVDGCEKVGIYGRRKGMCKAHAKRIEAASDGDTAAVFPSYTTENERFQEACQEYFRDDPIAPQPPRVGASTKFCPIAGCEEPSRMRRMGGLCVAHHRNPLHVHRGGRPTLPTQRARTTANPAATVIIDADTDAERGAEDEEEEVEKIIATGEPMEEGEDYGDDEYDEDIAAAAETKLAYEDVLAEAPDEDEDEARLIKTASETLVETRQGAPPVAAGSQAAGDSREGEENSTEEDAAEERERVAATAMAISMSLEEDEPQSGPAGGDDQRRRQRRALLEAFAAWPGKNARPWLTKFRALEKFKARRGHLDVPPNSRGWLGEWASAQRKLYRQTSPGGVRSLPEERVGLLNLIEFDWEAGDDAKFDWQFRKLKLFHEQHGHFEVPYSQDKSLYNWVKSQRKVYTERCSVLNRPLSDDRRTTLLDSIGFFAVPNDRRWETMFLELKTYKEEHGGCLNVPRLEEGGGKVVRPLYGWIAVQRKCYRLREAGKSGVMTDDRIRRLSSLGFEFFSPAEWKRHFVLLKEYRRTRGTTRVEESDADRESLRAWAAQQCTLYRNRREGRGHASLISDARMTQLRSIGFHRDWGLASSSSESDGGGDASVDLDCSEEEDDGQAAVVASPAAAAAKPPAGHLRVSMPRYPVGAAGVAPHPLGPHGPMAMMPWNVLPSPWQGGGPPLGGPSFQPGMAYVPPVAREVDKNEGKPTPRKKIARTKGEKKNYDDDEEEDDCDDDDDDKREEEVTNKRTLKKDRLSPASVAKKPDHDESDQEEAPTKGNPWCKHEDAIILEAAAASSERPLTGYIELAERLPGRSGKGIRSRWINHLNPDINRWPLTREDDMLLWEGHKALGRRWTNISVRFFESARTDKQLQNRWAQIGFKEFVDEEFGPGTYDDENGRRRREKKARRLGRLQAVAATGDSRWQEEEDAIIMEVFAASSERPFKGYAEVARLLPGRTQEQVRHRWVNCLNPEVSRSRFTKKEDLILWEGHKVLGKQWAEIALRYFQSARTSRQLQRRWNQLGFSKIIADEFGPDAYSDEDAVHPANEIGKPPVKAKRSTEDSEDTNEGGGGATSRKTKKKEATKKKSRTKDSSASKAKERGRSASMPQYPMGAAGVAHQPGSHGPMPMMPWNVWPTPWQGGGPPLGGPPFPPGMAYAPPAPREEDADGEQTVEVDDDIVVVIGDRGDKQKHPGSAAGRKRKAETEDDDPSCSSSDTNDSPTNDSDGDDSEWDGAKRGSNARENNNRGGRRKSPRLKRALHS